MWRPSLTLAFVVFALLGVSLQGCGGGDDSTTAAPTGTTATPTPAPAAPTPAPTPSITQMAWTNHFAAFGHQDGDRIMEDYIDESALRVKDITGTNEGKYQLYKGKNEILDFFTGLWAKLPEGSELKFDLVLKDQPGMVFLVWSAKDGSNNEILTATDSFVFNAEGKIVQQNTVVRYPATTDPITGGTETDQSMALLSAEAKASWDEHFNDFGAKNVDQIMDGYDEDSELFVYNTDDPMETGAIKAYKGISGDNSIRTFFEDVFSKQAGGWTDLKPRLLLGENDMVFLVWEAPAATFKVATDSFVFDPTVVDGKKKIRWQNIFWTPASTPAPTPAPPPAPTPAPPVLEGAIVAV